MPATNPEFWREKFGGNMLRDTRVKYQIEEKGWHVEIVWSCCLSSPELSKLVHSIRKHGTGTGMQI